jgi:hypothetical protein
MKDNVYFKTTEHRFEMDSFIVVENGKQIKERRGEERRYKKKV